VKVKREHAHVRARSGFFVTAGRPTNEQLMRTDIRTALTSPFDFTALPVFFRLNGAPQPGQNGKKELPFDVGLNPGGVSIDGDNNNHTSLEFLAVVRDGSMNVADEVSQHLEANLKPESARKINSEGMTYHNMLRLAPGDYSVRVVVRDNVSGRIGSLQAPIKVQ